MFRDVKGCGAQIVSPEPSRSLGTGWLQAGRFSYHFHVQLLGNMCCANGLKEWEESSLKMWEMWKMVAIISEIMGTDRWTRARFFPSFVTATIM